MKSEDRFQIQVLVVEDEPPTLRRIANMIERIDDSFVVAATALNGKIALEKMQEKSIDVVFTDINMPVLDGLCLMDNIQKKYPDCIVVVLSGYQDFQYMSHAIRTNSFDYLLKPVSLQAMQDVLMRIKKQFVLNMQAKLSIELTRHMSRAYSQDDWEKEGYDTELGLALFCFGGMPYSDDVELFPGLEAWSDVSLESIAHALSPAKNSFEWEFFGQTAVERVLIVRSDEQYYETWFEQVYQTLSKKQSLPIGCLCLSYGVSILEVNDALKLMRSILQNQLRIGQGVFICLGKEELRADEPIYPSEDKEKSRKLAKLFSSGQFSKNNPFCNALFSCMEEEDWTQARIAHLFLSMLNLMEHDECAKTREFAEQYHAIIRDAISTAASVQGLYDELCSIDYLDDHTRNPAPEKSGTAQTMKQYLDRNFTQSITNQTLSRLFGYVPSYISILFRQEYSVSPSEYLNKVRLDEARRLLETEPDVLIQDVAERVGFKNQHHFSRFFKKYIGMSPSGYQTAIKEQL